MELKDGTRKRRIEVGAEMGLAGERVARKRVAIKRSAG